MSCCASSRRPGFSDGVGVGAGGVGAPGGGGPGELAGPGLLQLPPGMLLELVVAAAGAAEVAAAGPAVVFVGQGVVQVGTPGRLAAGRVAAGPIPRDHVLS